MRRRPPRSVSAPKLCSALVLLGAQALAQPNDPAAAAGGGPVAAPLRLSWSSSEPDCDGDGVAARALQMVGRGVNLPPVEARADVSRDGSSWTVKLETQSENQAGTRVVSGETCREIQDAVALLLTLILESEMDAAPSPAPQPPDVPAAPSTPPEPPSGPLSGVTPITGATSETALFDEPEDEEPPPAGPRDVGPDLGWLLRLHGGASLGLQPDLGVGFGAAAGVHWRSWDFAVAASFWPSTRADPPGTGYVEIGRLGMGVRSCFTAWSTGHLDIAGCVLPELTLFQFASFEIRRERHGDPGRVLLSGTAALDFRYRLLGRHISAVLSPGVTWEKRQPFHVDVRCLQPPCEPMDPIKFHETSGLGGRLEIGVDARF